jgi:phosphoribosylaminoimidazolecarboxamide formyltransferase/IMP cyclohydrolase
MSEPILIRRALFSVYDKTGIVEFARALRAAFGTQIISTGGTARVLAEAGVAVTPVETVTGFAGILGGRVKTLHPAIFAAILAERDNPEHMRQLAAHGVEPIDLVVVNLYPFERTVSDPACPFERAIEMIDIGGVALLRAAAKNHRYVLAVTHPGQLDHLLNWLRGEALPAGGWAGIRRDYAVRALRRVSRYDAAISNWLERGDCGLLPGLPPLREIRSLRYGENPHQRAQRYLLEGSRGGFDLGCSADRSGEASRELSFNNCLDADAALALCGELSSADLWGQFPAAAAGSDAGGLPPLAGDGAGTGVPDAVCCFIKHTNPCGVGVAFARERTPDACFAARLEAYRRAYLGDPNAAMGGVLACNFEVDARFAAVVMETYDRFGRPLKAAGAAAAPGGFFVEVWLAPRFTDDALALVRGTYDPAAARPEPGEATVAPPPRKKWGAEVRLLAVGGLSWPPAPEELKYRSIAGGLLVQTPDRLGLNEKQWQIVTKRAPGAREMADLRLAWLICKHTTSNAVTIVRDGMLLGNGAGQMSRVMSCRVALWLARENGHLTEGGWEAGSAERSGPVAASDAFFPFRDGPELLLEAGITAIIQPGGSRRDAETIRACDERGAAMVFTGTRHFRH